MSASKPASGGSGKGSEETIAALTKNMVTSLTTKTVQDRDSTRIMVLTSTTSGSRRQLSQQERSIAMLEALEIPFETLNCALPEFKTQRDDFFEMSGIKGEFPQFFLIKGSEGTTTFLGQFDEMEKCNERSNWPKDSIKDGDITWDSIMGTKAKYNGKGIHPGEADDDSEGSGGGGGIYGALDDNDEEGGGGGNIYAGL